MTSINNQNNIPDYRTFNEECNKKQQKLGKKLNSISNKVKSSSALFVRNKSKKISELFDNRSSSKEKEKEKETNNIKKIQSPKTDLKSIIYTELQRNIESVFSIKRAMKDFFLERNGFEYEEPSNSKSEFKTNFNKNEEIKKEKNANKIMNKVTKSIQATLSHIKNFLLYEKISSPLIKFVASPGKGENNFTISITNSLAKEKILRKPVKRVAEAISSVKKILIEKSKLLRKTKSEKIEYIITFNKKNQSANIELVVKTDEKNKTTSS